MTETIIIPTVFNLVKVIEKKALEGIEKKEELYKTLKSLMGEESFNNKKDIIDFILETIIYISKTHKVLGINENTFNYCCLK